MGGIKKAVKSVTSGLFGGADSASNAAQAQVAGTQAGINEARRQFDISQQRLSEAQQRVEPFRQIGLQALTRQRDLLGLAGTGAQQAALSAIQESPSQKFLRERAERSLLRNTAAIGGLGGGNVRTALQEQAVGIAGQQLGEEQNRLASLASMGGGAAQTSSGIAQSAAGLGSQFGSQMLGAQQAIGQQQASGILGAQQANAALGQQVLGAGLGAAGGAGLFGSGAASALGGSAGSGALLGLLSDENMKEDIKDLDLKECFEIVQGMDLKSWRYIKETNLDRGVHFGPMAQDAPECIKISGMEMLNLHDELMLITGAIQYAASKGLIINMDGE